MPRKTYRKLIVTPDLIEKINPENKMLVDKFLKEKSTRSSSSTIKNYKSDGDIFFVWNLLNNSNKSFVTIKKIEFADFFSFVVEELKWGSARSNRVRSFLSSLSIFIEKFFEEEYPTFRNIVLKTIESSPKEFRREKTILSAEQVANLLKYLSETDSQKACWIALTAYSGSRFSEVLRFTTDIIDENHTAFGDLFLETTKQIKTKGRGREGKLLYKYILKDKFLPYYKVWLEDRKKILLEKGKDHNFIFIKEDGEPATESTVRSWITFMEKYLNVPFYPHSLRHFLVTEFSRKNIPTMLIKDLVGWTSIEMVNLYNDMSSKDKEWKELENLK
jgi:site-specific recombinase XerD